MTPSTADRLRELEMTVAVLAQEIKSRGEAEIAAARNLADATKTLADVIKAQRESETSAAKILSNEMRSQREESAELLDKCVKILYGDPGDDTKPGLIVKQDRVETTLRNRDWHLKALWGGIISLTVALAGALASWGLYMLSGTHPPK